MSPRFAAYLDALWKARPPQGMPSLFDMPTPSTPGAGPQGPGTRGGQGHVRVITRGPREGQMAFMYGDDPQPPHAPAPPEPAAPPAAAKTPAQAPAKARRVGLPEMAQRLGITASQMRAYERSGLFPEARRDGAGWHVYSDEEEATLRHILADHAPDESAQEPTAPTAPGRATLFDSPPAKTDAELAGDPQTSHEDLDRLSRHPDETIARRALANGAFPPHLLHAHASSRDAVTRQYVAEHPNTLPHTLDTLATDEDEYVRLAVAKHPQASDKARQALRADKSTDVREAAMGQKGAADEDRLRRELQGKMRQFVAHLGRHPAGEIAQNTVAQIEGLQRIHKEALGDYWRPTRGDIAPMLVSTNPEKAAQPYPIPIPTGPAPGVPEAPLTHSQEDSLAMLRDQARRHSPSATTAVYPKDGDPFSSRSQRGSDMAELIRRGLVTRKEGTHGPSRDKVYYEMRAEDPATAPSVHAPQEAPDQSGPRTPRVVAVPSDLSHDLAASAHSGTSHTPDVRARQEQQGVASELQGIYDHMVARCTSQEMRDTLDTEFERFKAGYLARYSAILRRRSGIYSSMIAGPSRFPGARMQKKNEADRKATTEFTAWVASARASMARSINAARTPDDAETAGKAIIAKEARHCLEMVHAIDNKDPRWRGFDRSAFTTSLVGFTERAALRGEVSVVEHAQALVRDYNAANPKPAITNRHSFWGLDQVAREHAQATARATAAASDAGAGGPETVGTYDFGQVVVNPEAERVQIIFEGKPDEATRAELRGSGWNWSPTNGAWQRKVTEASKMSARTIMEAKKHRDLLMGKSAGFHAYLQHQERT